MTAKIGILFLVDEFCDGRGGTEQHILFLLDQLSHQVSGLHFAVLSRVHEFDPALFPVEPLFLRNGCKPGPRGAFQRLRHLASFIKCNEIDVIHAISPISELFALLAVKLAGRGQVLGVRRNIGFWHTRSSLWQSRFVRLLGAKYVANCDAAKQFAVANEWIPSRRFTVIPNPIVKKRLEEGMANVPPCQSLGVLDDEQVVGIVANVRPVKNYSTFIHAASLVLKELPKTRFIAVGDQYPDTFPRIQSLAHLLGVERQLTWAGPMETPCALLPLFDVGVLSSDSEAFSNSLLEYAAAGVPSVATDVGGAADIVEHGRTGFLVPAGDPESMANRICQLLQDDALRKQYGEQARGRAHKMFSEHKILQEYVNLYMRLADRQYSQTG